MFVGTVLAPQRAKETKFQAIGLSAQALLDVLVLLLAKSYFFKIFWGHRHWGNLHFRCIIPDTNHRVIWEEY